MNKIFLLSTVAAMACFVCSNANATDVSNAEGLAKVKIVDAVALAHTGTALDFGDAMSAEAHEITVNPSTGAVTSSAPNQMVRKPNDGRDKFTATVPANMDLTIKLPEPIELGTGVNVTSFTSYPANKISATKTGPNDIYVGGTLSVAKDAASDDYSHAYTLTVSY